MEMGETIEAELEAKIAAAKLEETTSVDEAIERLSAQGLSRRAAATYAAHHHGTFTGDLKDAAAQAV